MTPCASQAATHGAQRIPALPLDYLSRSPSTATVSPCDQIRMTLPFWSSFYFNGKRRLVTPMLRIIQRYGEPKMK